jgi:hypothetical protein
MDIGGRLTLDSRDGENDWNQWEEYTEDSMDIDMEGLAWDRIVS